MDQLEYVGNIVNGIGKHAELLVPGRSQLLNCPVDWPEKLFPGSLNVRISKYPAEFTQRGLPLSAKTLDVMAFEPIFIIPRDRMLNNKLTATQTMPDRGDGQVWSTLLTASEHTMRCWTLRRIGSGLSDQIELVSSAGLRNELGLTRDREWPVVVKIFGHWRRK
jgi:hypothetical protein